MVRLLQMSSIVGVALLLCGAPALGEDLTTDDFIRFWQPIEGSWKMTSDRFGEIRTGRFEFKVAPNQKCILLYSGGEGVPFTQQLQGYDPVSKKQIAFGFSEDGNFQIQTITIDGMRKGMKAAKGVGGEWELKVFGTDGSTTTTTSKWKWEQLDKDKIVMVWSDVKTDGEPVEGKHKLTLERQK